MQEKSIIKQNILKYLNLKGITPYKFYKESGITRGVLDQNNGMNEKNTSKFLDYFPEVNANWLLTGKGNMLVEEKNTPVVPFPTKSIEKTHENQQIPLFDVLATASVISLFKDTSSLEILDTISIPNMPECDGAIPVTGDSMYPLIKSGDLILYKTYTDFEYILYGNMYLVAANIGGNELLMVKYIHKGETPDTLKLVSENRHHEDVEVHKKHIISIAIIKGSIRYNFMR